jgi:hypothetical protein
MQTQIKLDKTIKNQIFILNQIFEIENKLSKLDTTHTINRNIDKLKSFYKDSFDDNISLIIENPKGEDYNETRTDIEASIAGDSTENLIIVDVIKPIIRLRQGQKNKIIQRGIVIVQDKNTIPKNSENKVQKANQNKDTNTKIKIVKVFTQKAKKKKNRKKR